MPGSTPCLGLPFPVDTDPIDVAGDIEALAVASDTAICGISGKFVGEVFAIYVSPSGTFTPPEGALECNGDGFSGTTYPLLQSHLGGTTLPNMQGRFLRHKGGSFPSDGQTGGSDDAAITTHYHTTNNHNHTINHDHPAFNVTGGSHAHTNNHDHASFTSGSDSHTHNSSWKRSSWNWPGSGSSNYGNTSFGDTINTGSDSHSHSINVPNYTGSTGTTTSHTHTANPPNYSGNSGNKNPSTNNAGSSGANKNIPPFINVTYFIQAE